LGSTDKIALLADLAAFNAGETKLEQGPEHCPTIIYVIWILSWSGMILAQAS